MSLERQFVWCGVVQDWLVVCCLTSQQQARVSQGRICSDNFTCCHTKTEVADQTFYLTQSQHTDTGPTSPSADPKTPGAWQGSHWSANFEVTGMTRPRKKSRRQRESNPGSSALEADALTTRPTRRSWYRTFSAKQATNKQSPYLPLSTRTPNHTTIEMVHGERTGVVNSSSSEADTFCGWNNRRED